MMDHWSGKVAVVTGASSGIGANIAVMLADAGMTVVGLARRVENIEVLRPRVKGKGSLHAYRCDVAKPEDIALSFNWVEQQFGGVDVLINNAGVLHFGQITELGETPLTEEQVLQTYDVNIKGTVLCARHAVKSMKKRNFAGHIININSIAGHYIPLITFLNIYSSSKHAVTAFTNALTNEIGEAKSNIKVTSISPGLVKTEMVSNISSDEIPALDAKDIADAVLYVLSTPPHVVINELTITPAKEKRV